MGVKKVYLRVYVELLDIPLGQLQKLREKVGIKRSVHTTFKNTQKELNCMCVWCV